MNTPSNAFVGASWLALTADALAYMIGLWTPAWRSMKKVTTSSS